MKESRKGAAFFDFDGTICKGDSFLSFIRFTHGSVALYRCAFLNSPFIVLKWLGFYRNDRLKERFFSFFYKGLPEAELQKKGTEFAKTALPAMCYDSAIEVLGKHKSMGHDLYLLTASSPIWLSDWCKCQGMKLIGTEFEVINGHFTGKIKGKNCYGQEKLDRIRKLVNEYDPEKTYGYGDSKADRPFCSILRYSLIMPLISQNMGKLFI